MRRMPGTRCEALLGEEGWTEDHRRSVGRSKVRCHKQQGQKWPCGRWTDADGAGERVKDGEEQDWNDDTPGTGVWNKEPDCLPCLSTGRAFGRQVKGGACPSSRLLPQTG